MAFLVGFFIPIFVECAFSAEVGQVGYFVNGCPSSWVEAAGQEFAYNLYGDYFNVGYHLNCTSGYEDLCKSSSTWISKYKTGSNTYHYTIVDLRSEFIRGLDNGRGIDLYRVQGSTQADTLQGHYHFQYYASGFGNAPGGGNQAINSVVNFNNTVGPITNVKEVVTDGINGTPRTGPETRPRNVALSVCVRVKEDIVDMSSITIVGISTTAAAAIGDRPVDVHFQYFIFAITFFSAFLWGLRVGSTT